MPFGFSMRRGLGLALGFVAVTAATAAAQDTSSASRQDTSAVRNPPGYSGMERDTTMVPPSATGGTYNDSTWRDTAQDSTHSGQKASGNRGSARSSGATRPAGADTAASDTTTGDTTRVGQTSPRRDSLPEARPPTAAGDTTGQSSSR
jgi:hypothetical protein